MQRLSINTATALTGATLPAGMELTARHQAQLGEQAVKAISTLPTHKRAALTALRPAHGVVSVVVATSDQSAIRAARLGVATEATGEPSTSRERQLVGPASIQTSKPTSTPTTGTGPQHLQQRTAGTVIDSDRGSSTTLYTAERPSQPGHILEAHKEFHLENDSRCQSRSVAVTTRRVVRAASSTKKEVSLRTKGEL